MSVDEGGIEVAKTTTGCVIKKSKTQCTLPGCKQPFAKIIGVCKFCPQKLCLLHRLPEQHACASMHLIKKIAHSANEFKLLRDATKVNVKM